MKVHNVRTAACVTVVAAFVISGCARSVRNPESVKASQRSAPLIEKVKIDGQDVATLLNLNAWKFHLVAPEGTKGATLWLEEWTRNSSQPKIHSLMASEWHGEQNSGELLIRFPQRDGDDNRKMLIATRGATYTMQLPDTLQYFHRNPRMTAGLSVLGKETVYLNKDIILAVWVASHGAISGGTDPVVSRKSNDRSLQLKMRLVKDMEAIKPVWEKDKIVLRKW